jgi:hypothetical protein
MTQGDIGMYLVGLFLRFGIPLGLTIILAWILKNLDLQWLEEREREPIESRIEDEGQSQGCWVLQNFSHEVSAINGHQDACWKVRMRIEGKLPDECLDCAYFKDTLLMDAA